MCESYNELLKSFQQLWVNRKFNENSDAYTIIQNTIVMDLLDELTHPRARSTPKEKYNLAKKRILASTIPSGDQQEIIRLYEIELARLLN